MTISVITGCSTGIGYATALRLARDGHQVVATMRTPQSCDLASVAKEEDLDVEVRPLDVNDDASVDALFRGVFDSYGRIDVLVNNAGLGTAGVVEETDLDVFRGVMETNFFGAIRCTKAVLPSMREHGEGCIVNVSSQAGRIAFPAMSPYCASKWALEAWGEALAVEVEPFGIRVVLIEPGAIMTSIWNKVDMTPPTGPYAPLRMRIGRAVIEDVARSSPADAVATCISEAITTPEPQLRWVVGHGADRNLATRSRLTDAEWLDLWSEPDDEEFMRRMLAEQTAGRTP